MMKKMLVLALVLAVAGLANAGLALNPTADAPLSGVLKIAFTKDAAGNLEGYDMGIKVLSGSVTFSNPVLSTVGGWMVAPAFVTDATMSYRITAGAFPAFGFNGLTVDDNILTVNYTGTKDSVVQLYNFATTIGGQNLAVGGLDTVNLIPEPMTMALLGLGALFLRKK